MAKELNEDTGFNVSIKTLIGIAIALSTVIGMWFALQFHHRLMSPEWNLT